MLSEKVDFSMAPSAVFIAVNILLITVFTESSDDCAFMVDEKTGNVKSMRKYFILVDFKILWQMN